MRGEGNNKIKHRANFAIYKKEQISQKKASGEWVVVEGSDLRTGKVGRAEKMKIGGVHKKKKGKEFAAL